MLYLYFLSSFYLLNYFFVKECQGLTHELLRTRESSLKKDSVTHHNQRRSMSLWLDEDEVSNHFSETNEDQIDQAIDDEDDSNSRSSEAQGLNNYYATPLKNQDDMRDSFSESESPTQGNLAQSTNSSQLMSNMGNHGINVPGTNTIVVPLTVPSSGASTSSSSSAAPVTVLTLPSNDCNKCECPRCRCCSNDLQEHDEMNQQNKEVFTDDENRDEDTNDSSYRDALSSEEEDDQEGSMGDEDREENEGDEDTNAERSGDESGNPLGFSEPVYHYRRHFLEMDDDNNDDEEEEDYFPIAPKGTSKRSVWERLTDHQFYTGAHKERFDELGNGRGLAGREYLYLNDGMTESPSRTHEVFSSIIRFPRRPVVEEGYLGIQRFGVQNVTPKLMWLYRNGDKHHSGVAYFLKHHVKTLELFYQDATKIVDPLAGPVRRLYDQNLRVVKRLEDIVDGGKYLCSSGEPPTYLSRLEKFLSQWVVQTL